MDYDDGLACTTDSCYGPGLCVHSGPDADGDGHTVVGCADGDDCDDLAPSVHPGAPEICDGIDNDCIGIADSSFACVQASARDCTTACGTAGSQLCDAT